MAKTPYPSQAASDPRYLWRSRCFRRLISHGAGGKQRLSSREKPPQTVARRNARERRRVQAVNQAFARLRKHVPLPSRGKRVSKVKTLRLAIDYIAYLQSILARPAPAQGVLTFHEPAQRATQPLPHSSLLHDLSNSEACISGLNRERSLTNPYFRPPFQIFSDGPASRNMGRDVELDLSLVRKTNNHTGQPMGLSSQHKGRRYALSHHGSFETRKKFCDRNF